MKKTSELIWQDVQHQELFRIIDLLATQPERHALDRLTDYINYHFSLEEEYMKELNYPDLESHIQAHRSFADKIKKYIADQVVFDEKFAKELSEYISSWLTSHVFGTDKKLEEFILQSKYK